MLETAGIVERADWRLSDTPLSERGACIDGLRPVLERAVSDRLAHLAEGKSDAQRIGQRVLAPFIPEIISLVIEMASYAYAYDMMIASTVPLAKRRKRSRLRLSLDAHSLSTAHLHSDPEDFLTGALYRLHAAKDDVRRARNRIAYLQEKGTERGIRSLPPPVSFDDPSDVGTLSRSAGAGYGVLGSGSSTERPRRTAGNRSDPVLSKARTEKLH